MTESSPSQAEVVPAKVPAEPIPPAPTRHITYIATDLYTYFNNAAITQRTIADNQQALNSAMGHSMHSCFAQAFLDSAAVLKAECLDKGMNVVATHVDIDLNGRTNPNQSFMALFKSGDLTFTNSVSP